MLLSSQEQQHSPSRAVQRTKSKEILWVSAGRHVRRLTKAAAAFPRLELQVCSGKAILAKPGADGTGTQVDKQSGGAADGDMSADT